MIRRSQRADGTLRLQVYGRRNGKQVYLGTVDSEREATKLERKHETTQDMIAAGELPPEVDQRRTFGDAVKLWLKNLREAGSRSAEEYASRVEHHFGCFLAVPVTAIRREDVTAWRDRLERLVAGGTVNTLIGTLSSAFSYFLDRGWVTANPCARVKRVKYQQRVFPWLRTSEAITRLLAECGDNIRTLVAVLVGTGMRLDEALHLRWTDVSLERRRILVHKGRKGTTKSGRAREVPIFDSVLPVLRAMKLARGANVMLWPGAKVGRPLAPSSVREPFKAAAEMAGFSSELRVHDLRHSFAAMYLADHGDLYRLSRILGHSSIAVTERVYAHLLPEAFEVDYGRVSFAMPYETPVATLRAVE